MESVAFVYNISTSRVVFGAGSLAELPREIETLGARRALVLSTPDQRDQADRVAAMLGASAVGVFDRAVMHVPIETAREARDLALRLGADCAVAIGGGSTIGLGKAIALEAGLPIIAVPTTYAGSEMTPIYGITENGAKKTGSDTRVLPRTVIYDPLLSISLPIDMSVASGINAIAHAAEGLYAQDTNPIMSLIAQESVRALAAGLPRVVANHTDIDARADCLYGAWLAGLVLGNVGMALHHKLCHTLGGSFNLPHAQTHTVMLPHVIAFNALAAPKAARKIVVALGTNKSAAAGLFDLAHANGAPTTLRAIGMRADQLDRAADLAVTNPYWNPRPFEREGIRALLQRAFDGAAFA